MTILKRSESLQIYYTENVPLQWGRFAEILATGAGTSRPGGLPHNKFCTICNLYPMSKTEQQSREMKGETAEQQQGLLCCCDYLQGTLSELSNKAAAENAARQQKLAISVSFNSTFHLCMIVERDRLSAERRAYVFAFHKSALKIVLSLQ